MMCRRRRASSPLGAVAETAHRVLVVAIWLIAGIFTRTPAAYDEHEQAKTVVLLD